MPFDPNLPASNTRVRSEELRAQFNALKAFIDAALPIGTVQWWDKNLPGVPVFLRGGTTSGGTGGTEMHSHALPLNINGGTAAAGGDVSVFPPGAYTSDPASSFPPYCEMVLIIKIK